MDNGRPLLSDWHFCIISPFLVTNVKNIIGESDIQLGLVLYLEYYDLLACREQQMMSAIVRLLLYSTRHESEQQENTHGPVFWIPSCVPANLPEKKYHFSGDGFPWVEMMTFRNVLWWHEFFLLWQKNVLFQSVGVEMCSVQDHRSDGAEGNRVCVMMVTAWKNRVF